MRKAKYERAIRQGGETGDAQVDADCATVGNELLDLAFGLDRHIPFAGMVRHGGILYRAEPLLTVAIAQPAEFGQAEAGITLFQLDQFRGRITEAVAPPLLLEAWKVRLLGEEVLVDLLQILQRLLQRMNRGVFQPWCLVAVAPRGDQLAQPTIGKFLLALLIACLLQRQYLIEHEPARAGEAAQIALLLAVRHQFEFKGLAY
ncbi:hypothetical protein QU487_11190 [Crenobacter sp. SG2305]|nr:hypothetical protein [Crenobacter sp. SG2305]MDN0083311.1 hypothetical protein [Crenobacter sp. SG2305]